MQLDARRQQFFQFRPFQQRGGKHFVGVGQIVKQVFALIVAGILQAGQIEAADLHQPLVILLQGDAQLGGDFLLRGRTLQALLRNGDGGFDLFRLTALLARRPVQTAQAIENRSADLVFGVRLQLDVVDGIEIVDRRDQAEHAVRNQVVEADAVRQTLLDPPGDQAHLGQVFQDETFPLIVGHFARHRIAIHMLPPITCYLSMRPIVPCRRSHAAPDPALARNLPLRDPREYAGPR